MKRLIIILFLMIPVIIVAQDTLQTDPSFWDKTKGFFSDIDGFNVILIAFATFFGGLWALGRQKMKQIGELFLKAYEYTDDKRLSKAERQDLMQRFLAIIGKSAVNGQVTKQKSSSP